MARPQRRSRAASSSAAPWAWALSGVLLGLMLVTLVFAPARWLTAAVQQGLNDRLVFDDARGTLWQGSARLSLSGGAGSSDASTLPGRLSWHIAPGWTGLNAVLQASCCMAQATQLTLQPHWGGARLVWADSQSQWPARWLSGLGTPWNTLRVEGQLLLSTQALSLDWAAGRLTVAGRAQLDATELSSRLSTLKPMGSYRLSLQGGPTSAFQLETLEGRLQLSGRGQWVGARLRFDGVASATPGHLDALSNLLNIIGRRDGERAIIKVG